MFGNPCANICALLEFISKSEKEKLDVYWKISPQKYIEKAASLEGLSPQVPLYKVTEGNEPCFFTTYFSWDHAKSTVCAKPSRSSLFYFSFFLCYIFLFAYVRLKMV